MSKVAQELDIKNITTSGEVAKPFKMAAYASAPEIRQYIRGEIEATHNIERKRALEDVLLFIRNGVDSKGTRAAVKR